MGTKIVKGERRDKWKTKFSIHWAMPGRLLSYEKIVKGERRDKWKTTIRVLTDWVCGSFSKIH